MFLALGKKWPAAAIYYYHRSLRIVALKRWNNAKATAPGSASVARMTGSDLQGAVIKQAMKCKQDVLVDDYAISQDLGSVDHLEVKRELFDSAVRYVHMLLLKDLWPPWVTHKFPRALPRDGVLLR